jgi:hypothetical protein
VIFICNVSKRFLKTLEFHDQIFIDLNKSQHVDLSKNIYLFNLEYVKNIDKDLFLTYLIVII